MAYAFDGRVLGQMLVETERLAEQSRDHEHRLARLALQLEGRSQPQNSDLVLEIKHLCAHTRDQREQLEAMLVRLSEMVSRRLRDHHLHARTVQIKLRYTDFSTFTRARTLDHATQIDTELSAAVRDLFHKNWTGKPIRLLGVYAQSLEGGEGQTSLLNEDKTERWRNALAAVDKMREKYGDTTVSLAAGLSAAFRARVHENPENLPGKDPRRKDSEKESQHE